MATNTFIIFFTAGLYFRYAGAILFHYLGHELMPEMHDFEIDAIDRRAEYCWVGEWYEYMIW